MIEQFKEYLNIGIVKKVSPDKERAKNLLKDSERKMRVLDKQIKKLGIDEDFTNEYVLTCYDALMLAVRAKMISEGYNSSGTRAHEAEIAYLKELNFNENDIHFIDRMRYYRNGMLYYGTTSDKDYANKVIEFTKTNWERLKKRILI